MLWCIQIAISPRKLVITLPTQNKKRIYFLCKLQSVGKSSFITRLNKKSETGATLAQKSCKSKLFFLNRISDNPLKCF